MCDFIMFSVYVHIPFCLKKCTYCDFHSVAARPEDVPQKAYARAIIAETSSLADRYGLRGRKVGTVYFGGGTPTMFAPQYLEMILDAIHDVFSVEAGAEISIEANPETVSPPSRSVPDRQRKDLVGLFNRVSIGVQTFNDDRLRALGRVHSAETAKNAVKTMQDAGCKNVGVDLMWGLPGQTPAELEDDLGQALGLGTSHISAYQLTYEEREEEKFSVSEDISREMFLMTHNTLTSAGFEHYEISNFAKEGRRCRHNENYWHYGEWLGLGSGATSFIRKPSPDRFTANSSIPDYLAHKFGYDTEVITPETAAREYCFLGLRTAAGIDLDDFKRRFGRDFDDIYPGLRKKWSNGALASRPSHGNSLVLTVEGWLISDELFGDLFIVPPLTNVGPA